MFFKRPRSHFLPIIDRSSIRASLLRETATFRFASLDQVLVVSTGRQTFSTAQQCQIPSFTNVVWGLLGLKAAAAHPGAVDLPAFTPDPIRLAELKGSSTYSPPVSPTRGDAREIFAAIDKDQTFFNMLEARGLTLEPTAESSDVDKVSDRIDAVRCVDGRRRTLLHQACRCGNVQVANQRVGEVSGGRTPFHEAVSSATGKTALELLKLLFEHDPAGISIVDANGSHVLHLAAIHGNLDVIKCGRNMLHYATYNGRLDVIKWLLGEDNLRRGELPG
ncbi:Ankyrin repeat-containing domain [Phytophthora cactorum]|nr:Ankyrin repeat-containing domain [Phytophthora cactorum]